MFISGSQWMGAFDTALDNAIKGRNVTCLVEQGLFLVSVGVIVTATKRVETESL